MSLIVRLFRLRGRLRLPLAKDCLDPRDVFARLLELTGVFQFFRHRLAAQVKEVLLLLDYLALEVLSASIPQLFQFSFHIRLLPSASFFPAYRLLPTAYYATACRRATNRHRTGILCAMRARHRLAVGRSTPETSNITVPGLTTAAQNSGSPLPLPMRTSSGLAEIGLCGKIRMNNRPSRRRKWLAATRPASICLAEIQDATSVCRPYSPNATVLPRVALPFILPRWLLRNLTRFGIFAMRTPLSVADC